MSARDMAKTKKKSKKREKAPTPKASSQRGSSRPAAASAAAAAAAPGENAGAQGVGLASPTGIVAGAGRRGRPDAGSPASRQPSAAMQMARRRGVRSVVPRVVPWRDWAEWDEVRCGLMGNDRQKAARAVSRVRAWQSRGKVPHSVEATAALVEINHARAHSGLGRAQSDNELRLMYSMALVRLVNGIVDAVQQKKFAAPVSDLAGQVALPRILVDIRHTASHNALPSLPALSLAADRALQWLQQHYWDPQAAVVLTPPAHTVVPLLRQYVRVRSRLLASIQREIDAEDKMSDNEASSGEHQKKTEKRLKRETAASELLASILASTPALDVSHALIEPIIATSSHILAETLQDLGLEHLYRDAACPSAADKQRTLQPPGAGSKDAYRGGAGSEDQQRPDGRGPGAGARTLSQQEEALEECAKYVIQTWDDAMDDFEAVLPGFSAALRGSLLRRLQQCALVSPCASSSSVTINIPPAVPERAPLAGQGQVETSGDPVSGGASVVAGGVVVERESWLCFLATWLTKLAITAPSTGVSAAGKKSSTRGDEGAGDAERIASPRGNASAPWQAVPEQRDILRVCIAAPSVWTRRLLHTVLPSVASSLSADSSAEGTAAGAGGGGGGRKRRRDVADTEAGAALGQVSAIRVRFRHTV